MQDKDKKISQLRNLLSLAKNKIEQLKASVQNKDKETAEIKSSYEKKIKVLEEDSAQIMKQYEERLLRYQKSLEDSDNLVSKYQKQANTNSKSQEKTSAALTHISNMVTRIFTLSKVKDSAEAVEQLCNIEKCKEFCDELQKIQKNDDLLPIIKSCIKLTDMLSQTFSKKRQARLMAAKKEAHLRKQLQDQENKVTKLEEKLSEIKQQHKRMQGEWQNKIDTIAKSKAKISEEKTNLEFVKQLMIKVLTGPKEASAMALEVLSKVLTMSSDEHNLCLKKIK